ncbi:MAG TPA: DinB family protein [Vicinamibacterales bacterium]|nr:DinB family protein [Vicinamibacterales bacterium]
MKDTLLPEFDQEMAATRLVLERVPDAAFGWKPRADGYDLGGLAGHLAEIPRWGRAILERDTYDLAAPPETESAPPAALTSAAAVLDRFDARVREIRSALTEALDGQLMSPWTLKRGSQVILSMPRIAALRAFVVHHSIHHRGQLTVYLRMQDVALPALYGFTADELM